MRDDEGLTPLIVAIIHENLEKCRILLAKGASLTLRDNRKFGDTPLIYAVASNNHSIVKLLLDHDADVDMVGKIAQTALHAASQWGFEDLIPILLRHGSNIEAKEVDGVRPLHSACLSGNAKRIVKLLLDAGADANAVDDSGRLPLWFATRLNKIEVVKVLLPKTSNVNIQTYNGPTPLSIAARYGFDDIVKLLIEAGAQIIPQEPGPHVDWVDPKDRMAGYGTDALVEAYGDKRQDVMWTLLEAGAKSDPAEYAHWLGVWDRAEIEELRTLTEWMEDVRAARMFAESVEEFRTRNIQKVYDIDAMKRRQLAEELGIPSNVDQMPGKPGPHEVDENGQIDWDKFTPRSWDNFALPSVG